MGEATEMAATGMNAAVIVPGLRACVGYAEMLVADITAAQFAVMPFPNMNHPAFCLGHLAIYPDRVLELIGCGELAAPKQGYAELFAAGIECGGDPEQYPNKDEIVEYYLERHGVVAEALGGVGDDVFAGENPAEGRFKEMLPTVGAAVNFLMNNHPMAHLGQVSAWRRVMGLGSVM